MKRNGCILDCDNCPDRALNAQTHVCIHVQKCEKQMLEEYAKEHAEFIKESFLCNIGDKEYTQLNNSVNIYCQGTKKKGIPCKRYLGKLHSGKVELLCPICKTVNVVEDGEIIVKEKGE